MLEKRESVLLKKIDAEIEKAKQYTREKNKRAALQCLKKKKMYEQQAEALQNNMLRITDQKIMLEGAKTTMETVNAMKQGANTMKQMQKETNIDDVDKTMDEINETTDQFKQIQEALGAPLAGAEFDEDELDAELQELEAEELEKQLLEPVAPMPIPSHLKPSEVTAMPTAPTAVPQRAQRVMTDEERELEALQAEMAL